MVNNNTKDEKVEKLPKMKMGLLVGVKACFIWMIWTAWRWEERVVWHSLSKGKTKYWTFFLVKSMFFFHQTRRLEVFLFPIEIPGSCSPAYDFYCTAADQPVGTGPVPTGWSGSAVCNCLMAALKLTNMKQIQNMKQIPADRSQLFYCTCDVDFGLESRQAIR